MICPECGAFFCPDPPDADPGAVISPYCIPDCRRAARRHRQASRAAARPGENARHRAGVCPECGKRRFATRQAAERTGRHFASLRGGDRAVYECNGWFHITSKPRKRASAA